MLASVPSCTLLLLPSSNTTPQIAGAPSPSGQSVVSAEAVVAAALIAVANVAHARRRAARVVILCLSIDQFSWRRLPLSAARVPWGARRRDRTSGARPTPA